MANRALKVSPALQALIEKGLLDRLPVSFSAFTFSQIEEWELLFPAERSYYERLFGLLDRSGPAIVDDLFAPMRAAERKMGVGEKTWPKREFTLDQVDFLNRNPHYPEWRKAVSGVFARLDPVLDEETARSGNARLAIVIAPAEIPVDADRMWLRIERHGRRLAIEPPENIEDYLPLLLTGQPRAARAPSLADLRAPKRAQPYDAWAVECGASVCSAMGANAVKLSYTQLAAYRKRLMTEVRRLVSAEEIRGPRQLSARLKQMRALASESEAAHDAIVAEFMRAVLLAGNGTLLVNNTFVEWAVIQAVRRARPSIVVASFGIRNKIKPFTSLLIYTDQDEASPIPSQMDALGSYVDLEIFYQYLWQEFEKYAEYRNNTAYLFIGEGMDQALLIAPADFAQQAPPHPIPLARLHEHAKHWLNVS